MVDTQSPADAEFSAMQILYSALEPLDGDARSRVINYIVARLEISLKTSTSPGSADSVLSGDEGEIITEENENAKAVYSSLAELYDSTQPKSNSDKALVAGYWLQVCMGAESFDGHSANKELKHLGEGLANITSAIDGLKSQKPALALQLKKSGKSQQARKIYKITVAGVKAVEAMING